MPQRSDYKGLQKLALWILGQTGINNSAPREVLGAVVQHWGNQANISTIFATIFSSITIALFVGLEGDMRWTALPFFIGLVYFSIRAWAFGKCSEIACGLWK